MVGELRWGSCCGKAVEAQSRSTTVEAEPWRRSHCDVAATAERWWRSSGGKAAAEEWRRRVSGGGAAAAEAEQRSSGGRVAAEAAVGVNLRLTFSV